MKSKNKILILSVYPAPYRMSLFDLYFKDYQVDVFFEHSGGDARNQSWFQKGIYRVLDNPKDAEAYRSITVLEYALVLVFDYSSATAIKLIQQCKHHRVPYVINCDGVMLTKHGNFLKDWIKKYLISGAALCFASGENAKKYFLTYGAKKERIVLHTFSTLVAEDIRKTPPSMQEKMALREELALPLEAKIAIAVGRFIPLKRYDELIRAWTAMPEDQWLLLVGDGEEEERYKQTIAELGLNNVLLHPFALKERLMKYYQAADIFVHPTSYDVWGLVVNEAMACGLPVVVSDHCVAGLELVRDGENGYLVPMGDDVALCKRVTAVLSDDAVRHTMAECALRTIAPYTIENMAKTHVDAMKEIMATDG